MVALLGQAADDLPEADGGVDPSVEVVEGELLVGGVKVVVGQAPSHQDAFQADRLLQRADDWNGAAGAGQDGRAAEGPFQGRLSGADKPALGRHHHGVAAVDETDLELDAGRCELQDALPIKLEYALPALLRDQPHADLRTGLGRNHGLGPLAGKAALYAIDRKSVV